MDRAASAMPSNNTAAADPPPAPSFHGKPGFSKYDLVKIRVYLSDRHYYVLSRFLVSRVLTAAKVNHVHAVRMALDLKKRLVDRNVLELTQGQLEWHLFDIMLSPDRQRDNYGQANIRLYRMMSRFHHQRIPLVVMLAGTCCVGKSTLATQLAERLNLPSVLQSDLVYEMMRTSFAVITASPHAIWEPHVHQDTTDDQQSQCGCQRDFVAHYTAECDLVQQGLAADIKKCLTEGKSVIIEGMHIRRALHAQVERMAAEYSQQQPAVVIVPLLVTVMDEGVHANLWQKSRSSRGGGDCGVDSGLFDNIRRVQRHLLEEMTVDGVFTQADCNFSDPAVTLDLMHSTVLGHIQRIFPQIDV